MPTVAVILPAAGQSTRFGGLEKKPFVALDGRPVWQRSAELFWSRPDVTAVRVVVSPEDEDFSTTPFTQYGEFNEESDEEADTKFTTGIHVLFDETKHKPESIRKIREILKGYPGPRDVLVAIRLESGETVHVKSDKQKVAIAPELRSRLDDLLGPDSHRLLMTKPKLKSGGSNDQRRRRD